MVGPFYLFIIIIFRKKLLETSYNPSTVYLWGVVYKYIFQWLLPDKCNRWLANMSFGRCKMITKEHISFRSRAISFNSSIGSLSRLRMTILFLCGPVVPYVHHFSVWSRCARNSFLLFIVECGYWVSGLVSASINFLGLV